MSLVKQFSQQLKTLQEFLAPLGVTVKGLNHVKERFNSYHGEMTKGVDSDHIKIFKLSEDSSFGIAFYFATVSNPYLMVTHKVGKKIVSSQYKPEGFKQKLNQFITLLKVLKSSNNLTVKSVESTFIANFIQEQEYDEKAAVTEVVKTLSDNLKTVKAKYIKKVEAKNAFAHSLKEKKQKSDKAIADLHAKHNIPELKKKLDDAMSLVFAEEDKLMKEDNNLEDRRKLFQLEQACYPYEREVEKIINDGVASLPKPARQAAKDLLSKLK
jgi:hypothetical protein